MHLLSLLIKTIVIAIIIIKHTTSCFNIAAGLFQSSFQKRTWGAKSAIVYPEIHINFTVSTSCMPVLSANLNQLND